MGCSGSSKNNTDIPLNLKINEQNITSIIFNFDNRFKLSVIALPFFKLGNLFLQSLLKSQKTDMPNNINKYKFFYKEAHISNHFYQNDEVKALNIKTKPIEILVSEYNF